MAHWTAERISYKGWTNAWKLSNAAVALIVTADVGPRVLHFGLIDGENQFYEVESQQGLTGGAEFRMYGGHRLWVAPETERTDYPDNLPVLVAETETGLTFTAPPEKTGLQKEIALSLLGSEQRVRVVHRISNRSNADTAVSPWALSVLRPGGVALLPLPQPAPHGPEHLLPVSALAMWSYTDLTARCWRLGPEYIEFRQEFAAEGFGMKKLGLVNHAGWGAYFRQGTVFLKQCPRRPGDYVDMGVNFETFANEKFLELETLGPNELLRPGETCVHEEQWSLHAGVPGGTGDDWVRRAILPLVSR